MSIGVSKKTNDRENLKELLSIIESEKVIKSKDNKKKLSDLKEKVK